MLHSIIKGGEFDMKSSINKIFRLATAIVFTIIIIVPSITALNENTENCLQENQTLLKQIQTRSLGSPTPIWTYWAKSYILPHQKLIGKAILENNAGNYIITGDIKEDTKINIFLTEVDTTGAVLWFRVYDIGGSASYEGAKEEVTSIDEIVLATGDYGYVLTGFTDYYTTDSHPQEGSLLPPGDLFVMQVKNNGDPIWLKTYLNLDYTDNYQIGQEIRTCTIDGNTRIFVIGNSDTPTASNMDIIALLLDIDGNVIRYVQLDSNIQDSCASAAVFTDASGTTFGICGYRNPGSYGREDPLFIRLTSDLTIIVAREYGIFDQNGVSNFDRLLSIQTTSDNGFIMAGRSDSHPDSTLQSVLVIKTDNNGKPGYIKTFNELPPNGLDNWGIAIDELPSKPDNYVLTCWRGDDPDFDLGIMGFNKTIHLQWARYLQAGKPNFPCNTDLLGAEIMFDLIALTDGIIVTGSSDSSQAVPDTHYPGLVISKLDQEGYIRKDPTPCCTKPYELFEKAHDENQTIDLERTLIQYEVPDWMPSHYNDTPKSKKICTPGFETLILISAIAIMFLILKKHKKQ